MSIKVVELFSGIGSTHKALSNLGIDFEVVGISDWDINAIISYDAIHTNDGVDHSKDMSKDEILKALEHFTFSTDGKTPCDTSRIKLSKLRQLYNANLRSRNLGDITKVIDIPKANFWSYSSPCQTISVAGKQAGLTKDSGTASSLIWDVERLLEIAKSKNELPEYLLLENVKNLVGKQFKPDFDKWVIRLEQFGYNTYWKVLNSKDFGVPQQRQRVFAISIRKDIDNQQFKFPEPFDNGLRLKDFLEKNVDEKYYISEDKTEKLLAQLKDKEISKLDTLSIKKVGNVNPSGNGMNGNVFHEEGLSPTITTNKGEGNKILMEEPNVLSPKRTEYGKQIRKKYEAGLIDEKIGNMRTFEPRTDGMCNTLTTVLKDNLLCVPCVTSANKCECIGRLENVNGHDFLKRVYSADSCSPTITTVTGGGHEMKILEDIHKTNNRIRKLTEIECIKLMGFTVEDAIKMKNADVSNSKIYHCAGNSIVVPLLEKLFANLLQLNN